MTGNDFGNEPGVGLKLCVKAQTITGLRQFCRAASHQPAFGALRQGQTFQRGVELRLPLVEVEFAGDMQSTGGFRWLETADSRRPGRRIVRGGKVELFEKTETFLKAQRQLAFPQMDVVIEQADGQPLTTHLPA